MSFFEERSPERTIRLRKVLKMYSNWIYDQEWAVEGSIWGEMDHSKTWAFRIASNAIDGNAECLKMMRDGSCRQDFCGKDGQRILRWYYLCMDLSL